MWITLFDQLTDETFKDMRSFSFVVLNVPVKFQSCIGINEKKRKF